MPTFKTYLNSVYKIILSHILCPCRIKKYVSLCSSVCWWWNYVLPCNFQSFRYKFYSLSETRRGWKGLTPLPSLRSKAHKVIREILLYIRAQYAFKLGHANFPKCISCNIVFALWYHQTCISYFSSIENPPNVHLGNFRKHWKWPPLIAYLWGSQYLKGRKCNFRDSGELIHCCI